MGARCSGRAAIRHSWCNGSSDRFLMMDPLSYYSFQPVSMTGKTKAMICSILSVEGMYKRTLAANQKEYLM